MDSFRPKTAATAYELATTQHPNPLVRFSHRRRSGLAAKLAAEHLPKGGAFLDFGAGEGAILHTIGDMRPDVQLAGVEPFAAVDSYRCFAHAADVVGQFDVISSFEVLEHMDDREEFFGLLTSVLKPGGVVIVSVPNMLGPIIIPKALNAIRTKASWRYSAAEMVRAAFILRSPSRGRSQNFYNHRGFDWRDVRRRIAAEFTIIDEFSAPFRHLPWWMNSQWFCVFGKSK